MEEVKHGMTPETIDPLGASSREPRVLERQTRVWFHDKLLTLLGWDLGIGGDVGQEVRIKANTTRFIDYVGMTPDPRAEPVIVFEAKAWDEPAVAPRSAEFGGRSATDLIVDGLRHVRDGGEQKTSPIVGLWHRHLEQTKRYVCAIHANGGHKVARSVISSGTWMVVFKEPTETFVGSGKVDSSHIEVLEIDDFLKRGRDMFRLLGRRCLVDESPFVIRVGQLGSYLGSGEATHAFHAVHVRYEESGSSLFRRFPRVLVYAALVFERKDRTTVTVVDERPVELPNDNRRSEDEMGAHLAMVGGHANDLLERCSAEMDCVFTVHELARFRGFTLDQKPAGRVVKPLGPGPNEWLLVTGRSTHFLRERPEVPACKFHSWAQARAQRVESGPTAVSTPSVGVLRSFFVDQELHHCAHQVVLDRKTARCHIAAFDHRICCRACGYVDTCWTQHEISRLPCGT